MKGEYPNTSRIRLLSHKESESPKMIADFKGVFDTKPETEFDCHGACIDNSSNILFSDGKYKKIYALDENLKFKSVI